MSSSHGNLSQVKSISVIQPYIPMTYFVEEKSPNNRAFSILLNNFRERRASTASVYNIRLVPPLKTCWNIYLMDTDTILIEKAQFIVKGQVSKWHS
jgi:hypothetical protein